MKDLDRLKTIQAVIDRDMKPGMAAQRLGMSVRQIERLVIRYRADGQQIANSLLQADDGNFYGVTTTGGENNAGTVFKLVVPGSH